MTIVSDILTFLETLAPTSLKMDWDNVGLLCGSRQALSQKFWLRWIPLNMCAGRRRIWGPSSSSPITP